MPSQTTERDRPWLAGIEPIVPVPRGVWYEAEYHDGRYRVMRRTLATEGEVCVCRHKRDADQIAAALTAQEAC